MSGEIPRNPGRVDDPEGRCAWSPFTRSESALSWSQPKNFIIMSLPAKPRARRMALTVASVPKLTFGPFPRKGLTPHHSGKGDLKFGRGNETAAAVCRLSPVHPLWILGLFGLNEMGICENDKYLILYYCN